MTELSNLFSSLNLDVDGDSEHKIGEDMIKGANTSSKRAEGKKKGKGSLTETILESTEQGKKLSSSSLEEFKMPLVWIDLEMSGLNVEVDRILEIACVITDGNLCKILEGPDLVIHQTDECLNSMGEWCRIHHEASGLTRRVRESAISEKDAEKQVIEFVKKHVGTYTPNLAGNSVYVDLGFLKKYMPDLTNLFSHVIVDVSSIKVLCTRWYPKEKKNKPPKEKKHRALQDIQESIMELKYYKDNIFKSKSRY